MNPIQIEDPITNHTVLEEGETVIGIDFGTTNSLAAIYDGNNMKIVCDILPSVVTFSQDGTSKVGDLGHLGDKSKINDKSKITISSIKAQIGKSEARINIFGRLYNPVEISSIILKHIKLECEKALGKSVTKAVITVPAYFDDTQRNMVKEAALISGIEVIRLLNEPTAASIFYDVEKEEEGIYAVFDLGGGTFDVSILRMQMGATRVLAVGGDTSLGGDNFDEILAKDLSISNFEARKVKEEICTNGFYDGNFGKLDINDFDSKIIHLVHKMVKIFRNTLLDAEVEAKALKGIILVGGSTRMPIIKEALTAEFQTKIWDNVDADRIVAFGAALHAFNITNMVGSLLLDIVPLTIGIETVSGMVLKIIPRNSPIPCEASEELTTWQDNQTGIVIHVVQGEREFVKDCRSLAHFELSKIPPMPKGVPKIKVSFRVDIDGILSVFASEEISEREASIAIRPTHKLEYADIRQMFEMAMEHGKDDIQKRVLEETKIEAMAVLEYAKQYQGQKELKSLISELEVAINSNICEKINDAINDIKDCMLSS